MADNDDQFWITWAKEEEEKWKLRQDVAAVIAKRKREARELQAGKTEGKEVKKEEENVQKTHED